METCPIVNRPCNLDLCRRFWKRALLQKQESLSDDNRYYFWLRHGRPACNDGELFAYYVESKGALNFALREMEPQSA
ncbi:MAG: hypothetical protein WC763_00965 [Candidatus Paceibacterota bacterium]|jgi:hypothetical protein